MIKRILAWLTFYSNGPDCRMGYNRLMLWFGLSYASFLVVPRVMMQDMPDEWQYNMARLLEELDGRFTNQPDVIPKVTLMDPETDQIISTPDWIICYRHPNRDKLAELRGNKT